MNELKARHLENIKKALGELIAEEYEIICTSLIRQEILMASDLYRWNKAKARGNAEWVELLFETFSPKTIINYVGEILEQQGYKVKPAMRIKVGVPKTLLGLGADCYISSALYQVFGADGLEVSVGYGDDHLTAAVWADDENFVNQVLDEVDRTIVMIATQVLDADDEELAGLANWEVGLLKDLASKNCPFQIAALVGRA